MLLLDVIGGDKKDGQFKVTKPNSQMSILALNLLLFVD